MNSNATIDLNQNQSNCIQSYDTLNTTHYVNICTNKSYDVPWGIGAWLLILFLLAMTLITARLVYTLITD